MLTKEEQAFVDYWQKARQNKKKFMRTYSIGLPLAAVVAAGTLLSLFTGWHRRAEMELKWSSSSMIVLLMACAGIVVFITLFSAHHKWDQNELHYAELMVKKDTEGMQQDSQI